MFKFISWTYIFRLVHGWILQINKVAIPIYFACFFIVFTGCNIKTSFAEEGDKTSEIRNSKLDAGDRLQDSGINLICGKVQFNRWMNALEFSKDLASKSAG